MCKTKYWGGVDILHFRNGVMNERKQTPHRQSSEVISHRQRF